jgi:hypothetical protein
MLIDGSTVAFCSRSELAHYLRSIDLAKRAIHATRVGLPGWAEIVRDKPDLLITASSARRIARRIAAGEMPPQFPSKARKHGSNS